MIGTMRLPPASSQVGIHMNIWQSFNSSCELLLSNHLNGLQVKLLKGGHLQSFILGFDLLRGLQFSWNHMLSVFHLHLCAEFKSRERLETV